MPAAVSKQDLVEPVADLPIQGEQDDEQEDLVAGEGEAPKKKKKSKKKPVPIQPGQDNSIFRRLGSWPEEPSRQTWPEPTVRIREAFPSNVYPVGEIQEYIGSHSFRTTSEEKRALEREFEVDYNAIRLAAECQRETRRYAQSYLRPGMKMVDICTKLEQKGMYLIGAKGLESGRAFPTGCSLNHVAAHYSPNYGDELIITEKDICKLDFGIHVGGRIVDTAFTVAFDPIYDPLIQATQDGTNTGLRESGVDARFSEIGAAIQEVIESYEMEYKNKTLAIKSIRGLNGHTISPYKIHAGKSVPIVKNDSKVIMEEGEVYAIETFASTGKGTINEEGECSHYMMEYDLPAKLPKLKPEAQKLWEAIQKNFSTLAFARRWLDDLGHTNHFSALKQLVDAGLINEYPPLVDIPGCFTSQMEHTMILRPTCKEIVSRGFDY